MNTEPTLHEVIKTLELQQKAISELRVAIEAIIACIEQLRLNQTK